MRAQRASVDRSQETSTSAPLIPPSLDCILEVKAGCSVEGEAWARASTSVAPSRGSGAAHERLRALASEHYSDANLLLMLASLLTVWAGGMATPFASAGEKDGALEALARAIEAVTLEHQDATDSPLWDRMADRLDPACAGEAWAEHKAHQACSFDRVSPSARRLLSGRGL